MATTDNLCEHPIPCEKEGCECTLSEGLHPCKCETPLELTPDAQTTSVSGRLVTAVKINPSVAEVDILKQSVEKLTLNEETPKTASRVSAVPAKYDIFGA